LSTVNGHIAITQGVEGNVTGAATQPHSLSLISSAPNTVFTLGGPQTATEFGAFNVENITITGLVNGNGTLFVSTADSQVWTVTQNNGGRITGLAGVNADHQGVGFGFTNIANIIGGSGNVSFTFDGAPILSGTANGGSNMATTQKTMDYSSYGARVNNGVPLPVSVTLTDVTSGFATLTATNSLVNRFKNMNQIVGSGTAGSTLYLPPQQTTINYTGALQGNIVGGAGFRGFTSVVAPANVFDNVNFTNAAALVLTSRIGQFGGLSIFFSGFDLNSFRGSFIPILLAAEGQALRQVYLSTKDTVDLVSTYADDAPAYGDGALFSIDLPNMNVVAGNIAEIIRQEEEEDKAWKRAALKKMKVRQVLRPVAGQNQ
jgi:hypothetical protein